MHHYFVKLRCALSVAVLLGLSTGFCAAQDQITLNPQVDTWIRRTDMADRSTYEELNVAGKSDNGLQPQESALLRFDLGALHRHDWVDHAEVTLHVQSSTGVDVYNEAGIGLFAVKKLWASNANWTYYNPDYPWFWSQSGCEGGLDRDSSPDALVEFYNSSTAGDYTWQHAQLTATVQDWQRGARLNRGWLVRMYGGIFQAGKTDRVQFCSNEWSISDSRPELFLTYHREAIDWKDDTGAGGVWDTTSNNWTWIGGDTRYVDGADPDQVRFSQNTGGVISVSGTVAPAEVTVTDGWWIFRDGAIGGSTHINVDGGGVTQPIAQFEAANTFTGRVNVWDGGMVQVSVDGALGGTAGGQYTSVGEGGMLAFTAGVDYTAEEDVYCQGHGPSGWDYGALGAFHFGESRFAGVVRVLDDTSVYVEGNSELELTQSLYMASDYELTVRGGGTLELSGDQTFVGRYVVATDTTLRVNNATGSATGVGSVTLQDGSTLGGSGTIAGQVTALDGATLAPGNSFGTLTVGSLELNSLSHLAFQLGQPGVVGSQANDLLVVNGDLVLDGILDVSAEDGFGEGTYTLMTWDTAATFTDQGLVFGDMPEGYLYELSTANPDSLELVVTVPEPTTLGLLGLGGLTMMLRRKR